MAGTLATQKAPSLDDPDDPWVIARNRFTADLSECEKRLFDSASLENLYYTASNCEREDRTSSKAQALVQKMRPLVVAVEDYGKALDTFTNMAPLYLAPIWGSVRVFLAMAKKYTKFYAQAIEMFSRIGDLLPRFRDYQRLFDSKKHQRLTQALSNAYLDIIGLCTKFRITLKEQKVSALKRILKPLELDTELEEAIQKFRDHKETVEKEAEICHMIEAKEARAIILANKELQEREQKANRRVQLLGFLSGVDDGYRHRALGSMRHEGTCLWALASPEYQNWLHCPNSAILCCYGIPGCGKSVLASAIIDALPKSTTSSAVTHYYCDYADKRTLEPINIFASLARGLLQHVPIPSSVEKLIVKCYGNGNKSPELRDVLQILRTLVDEVFDSVTMVLDGLDEVKDCDRQNINQAFKSLWGGTKPIKLLLCSRDDDVSAMTPPHVVKHRLQVLPTTIGDDIKVYVTHSVRTLLADGSLVVGNEDLEQLIIDCLVDGAKGMFLWVKFQLAELCTAETDSEVNRILENLPKDLGETYDRLLGRINGEQREDLVRRMFQWIICAKRPLYIDELREAIAFGIEDRHWDGSKIPTQILRVVRACGNLVVISEETRHVSLAHYTVQQYVLGKPYDLGSSIHFTMEEANIAVAQVCIAYLCFSDFESQVSNYMDTTNNDMKLIQEMVSSFSVVPDDYLAKSAVKIWDYFRGGPSATPKQIDYRRYVNRRAPNEHLLQKFRILEYISNNWLLHSTCLDHHMDKASRTYRLFQALILHKNFLFDVFPWNYKGIQNREVLLVAQAGWAIKAQHLLLLAVLTDDNPGVYLMHRAGVKLHGLGPYKSILDRKFLEKLPNDSESIPETIERAYLWLYSKVLSACRQGNGNLLTGLKSGLLSVHESMGQPASSGVGSSRSLEAIILGHLFFEASMHGQEKLVADIVDSFTPFSKLFLEHDGYCFSPGEMAALRGHVNIVKITRALWEPGELRVDLGCFPYLRKALVDAAGNGNGAVVEDILMVMRSDRGLPQDIEAKNSALRESTLESAHEIVLLLLENGGDPLDEGLGGNSALEIAISCGNVEIVRTLVGYSDINITSPVQVEKFETHSTSISGAQYELKKPELDELRTHATSNSDTQLGLTKSEILLRYRQQAAIRGSRIRRQGSFTFRKPSKIIDCYLRLAIALGHNEIATMFIDMFVDMFVDINSRMNVIEAKKSFFREHMMTSLLLPAVTGGHLKTVQLLLDKGAEVDQFGGPAGDLLQSNSRGAAKFPNLQTYRNDLLQAPLRAAAISGYDDIVAVLLAASTALEAPPSLDQCPLYQAAKFGHSKVVSVLLEAGVDPGPSLLAHINSKNHQIVRRLIEAALNLTPSESWGPYDTKEARENSYLITIATRCGKTEIVRYLLAARAKTADKDKNGMSALLWAILCGHDEIVKLLLNYRALFKADESQRARALNLACRSHQANLALMLLARHSREWTETTDGLVFKLDTLKKIEGLARADIGCTERVNAIVRMEVRRRREEMESWTERSA